MQDFLYRQKWEILKNKSPDIEAISRLARQVAYSFLDKYLHDHSVEEPYLDLLCEMGTSFDQSEGNEPGARALFGIIIESLCDEFEELQAKAYNQVMTRVIACCRGLPAGKGLDRELKLFGIHKQSDLLQRISELRQRQASLESGRSVRTILLLSRVTLGADVAISSVFVQRLQRVFPEARIVIIGTRKLEQIFAGNPGLSLRSVHYERRGGLFQRLSTWHQVLEIIREETRAASRDSLLLFDPDSRLSQLGILPLCPFANTFFFDSRSNTKLDRTMSMAEMANEWLDSVLQKQTFCFPRVWVRESSATQARELAEACRAQGARRLVSLNFGVGGNERKRVGLDFERALMAHLLQEPKTVLFLDRGAGEDELSSSSTLLQQLRELKYPVQEQDFGSGRPLALAHGILGLRSSFGAMAALIAQSDEYIGYDSAFQHIAAAQATPCLTVFAGSNNMRFIRRWSAFGPKSSRIIHVDTLNYPKGLDIQDIVVRVMHQRAMAEESKE